MNARSLSKPTGAGIRLVCALAFLWAGPALPARAAWSGSGIKVKLDLVGGVSSVHQGTTFSFEVTARNTGGDNQTVTITIELDSPSSADQDIRSWDATVPPGGSVSDEMSAVTSQWFSDLGTFTLVAKLDGIPTGNSLPFSVTPPTVTVPVFQDVTGASGLDTVLPSDAGTSHAEGAAWGDVNGDGYPDLYVPIRDQPAQLWIFDPGTRTFSEQAGAWKVTNPGGAGVSATFADFDNDGDPDLYVVNDAIDSNGQPTLQGNRLYRNEFAQGHAAFTDISVSAGVGTQGNGASASWGDYDGDGYLDLYAVTGDMHDPPITYYQQDHLFRNEGDGTFTDVTCQSLPTNDQGSGFCPDPAFGGSTGSGFEAVWIDYDGDGDQDLYLAQDYYFALAHKDMNRLYRNDGLDQSTGHWKFTDVCAGGGGAECLKINSMGVAVGDVDGDQWPDIAVSNSGYKGGNVLLRNDQDGTFTEMGATAGIARPDQTATVLAVTWGLGFADFDLDGFEDLYVAAGSLAGAATQPNQLFAGTGDASFFDLSAPSGATDPGAGRGVSLADYDRDGLVDLYLVDVNGSPILYRNVTAASGTWVEVKLTGRASNRDGCGARVVITPDGQSSQARWMVCGSSLGAGNDPLLHFGGVGSGGFRLDVVWPSGVHQALRGTAVDRLVKVKEP